jgi:hypothetical protein
MLRGTCSPLRGTCSPHMNIVPRSNRLAPHAPQVRSPRTTDPIFTSVEVDDHARQVHLLERHPRSAGASPSIFMTVRSDPHGPWVRSSARQMRSPHACNSLITGSGSEVDPRRTRFPERRTRSSCSGERFPISGERSPARQRVARAPRSPRNGVGNRGRPTRDEPPHVRSRSPSRRGVDDAGPLQEVPGRRGVGTRRWLQRVIEKIVRGRAPSL